MRRAILAISMLLLLGAGGAIVWLAGSPRSASRLSDGGSIVQASASAPERRVLWTPPEALGEAISTSEDEYEPSLTRDGGELFFVRGRAGGGADILHSTREGDGWSEPEPLPFCSAQHDELGPRLSPDGRTLYFYSDRPGGFGGHDLWSVERIEGAWAQPRNLGDRVNTAFNEYGAAISPDGTLLVFASNRPRDAATGSATPRWPATLREEHDDKDYDLFAASLGDHGIGRAARIDEIASAAHDGSPAFSPVGDFLYFASDRAGGAGGFDLYRVRLAPSGSSREAGHPFIARAQAGDDPRAFGVQHLGPGINTPFHELDPSVSSLGFELHFSSDRERLLGATGDAGQYDIFRSESREVYRTIEALETDWSGLWGDVWPWLVWLLLLLALLLLLLWALRSQSMRERYRRLSLLAKCLIISMLLHLLLLSAIGAYRIGTALGEIMDRDGGARVALVSREGASDIARQVRGEITSPSVREATLSALAAPVQQPAPLAASATIDPTRTRAIDRALEAIERVEPEARPIEQPVAVRAVDLLPVEATPVEVSIADRPDIIEHDEASATPVERSMDALRAAPAEHAPRTSIARLVESPAAIRDAEAIVDVALALPSEIAGAIPESGSETPPQAMEVEREAIDARVAQPTEVVERAADQLEASVAQGLSASPPSVGAVRGPLGTVERDAAGASLAPEGQDAPNERTLAKSVPAPSGAPVPPAEARVAIRGIEQATDVQPVALAMPSEDVPARENIAETEPAPTIADRAITQHDLARHEPAASAHVRVASAELSIAVGDAPPEPSLLLPSTGARESAPADDPTPAMRGPDLTDAPPPVVGSVDLERERRDEFETIEPSPAISTDFGRADGAMDVRGDIPLATHEKASTASLSPGSLPVLDRSAASLARVQETEVSAVAPITLVTDVPDFAERDLPVGDVAGEAPAGVDALAEPVLASRASASGLLRSLPNLAAPAGEVTREAEARPAAIETSPEDAPALSVDRSFAHVLEQDRGATPAVPLAGDVGLEPAPRAIDALILVERIDDAPSREVRTPSVEVAQGEIRVAHPPRLDDSAGVLALREARPSAPSEDVAPRESLRPIPLADFSLSPAREALVSDPAREVNAEAPEMPVEDLSLGLETPVELGEIPGAYRQRDERVRSELIEDLGGSVESEAGVALALSWLARHQSPEGFWSGHTYDAACGECDGRSRLEQRTALTGLATLAFLGADHTHLRPGEHRETVRRAVEWLIAQQDRDGDLSGQGDPHAHALGATALAEALALTSDPNLRGPVASAVAFIESRHEVESDPWAIVGGDDTPTLSWEVMALVSAQRAGLDIPRHVLDSARDRLDALMVDPSRGLYALEAGGPPNRSATAEAMFARRLLGVSRDDPRMERSARALARDDLAWGENASTFEWYMTTLSLHQHQGEHWQVWNGAMRDLLLARQERSGLDAGSWPARDPWSLINGRVHQTALGALMLESYYRYLPDFMNEEILDSGVVRGRVLDARTNEPIAGAIVRLDLADRPPIIVTSGDTGRYTLRPQDVPDHVAMTATKDGYQPASINVPTEDLLRGVVERDFLLERQVQGVIALEAQPEVHHLGNDEFTGRINSQFQRPSEGLVYQRSFTVSADQIRLVGREAQVRLLAKGTQAPNPVRVNGRLISRRLVGSPDDGSFGEWVGSFPGQWLVAGENVVEIRSTRGDSDLDDFEFVNVRIVLDAR